MSLVCLMMGLRVPLFPPLDYDIESFTKGFGSRGGGGIFIIIMTGLCGPNLEDPYPYSYKGQARKRYLFIYFFQEGTPWVLHLHLRHFAFIPRAKFLCRVRMPIAV